MSFHEVDANPVLYPPSIPGLNLPSDLDHTVVANARFWPERSKHSVAAIKLLNPSESALPEAVIAALKEATQLAEIIRIVEDLDISGGSEGLGFVARTKTADALERAADGIDCTDSALSLRIRARILRHGSNKVLHDELTGLDEKVLMSVCGPLGTWLGKSKGTYHSALFAIVNTELNDIIAKVDACYTQSEAFLRELVNPDLVLGVPPAIKFTELMFCGGEANLYPKHFAYFLPEDEGMKRAPRKKTLVLSNVYREMYYRISKPFSKDIIPLIANAEDEIIDLQLALWFRGHDTGHEVRLPQTDYKIMRCEGRWLSMVMQEAMADVFGFLLSTSGPWTTVAPNASLQLASDIYIREMLRYLCRGGDDFPDAGAALIQMSFLSQHGFIDIDHVNIQINTTHDRLYAGMVALAKTFTERALANNVPGIQALINDYYRDEMARDFVKRCGVCDVVLDYAPHIS
ncbi:hypothetical protein GGQ73_004545 [Rhizobium skierniewicense]|uniref:Uncharacterized protein n=1 Tax=Rhizobium skierniewicense TaxID=984260 RepID=A0A7W6CEN6_9HYPH|nr:hypothetical protein [Rhizobium skierniewicense]MBB3948557.1 hypothetical protein [Rhizobium skierniewicense]